MDNFLTMKGNRRTKRCFLAFFLLNSLFFNTSTAFAQNERVSVNAKNESVEVVLKKITKQIGVNFFYDPQKISQSSRVSLNVNNQTIEDVLKSLSKQTGLVFDRNKNTINVGFKKNDKVKTGSKNLKGRVVDQNGDAVIGASIQVKGTTVGVITDFDGNYELNNVPNNSQIVISYIGYQTVTVNSDSKNLAVVTLREDTELLDEVVVVGYGTMKKKDLLGATSMVSGDQLATNSSISVGGALQGKMSGINIISSSGFPGSSTSINIRGIGTFGNGDTSPLVVIDGVPVDQGFETLNPTDIESVNVLKDASSAAIYGSRAANGVILITTKKGAEGKAKISVNATWVCRLRRI